MQVQICQAVNTHKQTTGEIVVVYEQRCGEKREGRGGTGACDTMWSNRVTEESTRQPRKRALGHAHALVTLALFGTKFFSEVPVTSKRILLFYNIK